MIHDIACRAVDGKRQGLYDFLRKKRSTNENYRIIDIGGTLNPYNRTLLTAMVDINRPKQLPAQIVFYEGNANDPSVWSRVEADVRRHGKFDFSICTHMLEDIANPAYVCKKLGAVADRGFVAVPSKYKELSRFEIEAPAYRGFLHHRWILTIRDHAVEAFPKLNFLDFDPYFDSLTNDDLAQFDELSFWWKDSIELKIVNDDFLGPTSQSVVEYYKRGLTGDDLDADLIRQRFTGADQCPGPVAPDPFEMPAGGKTCRRETCIGLFLGLAKRAINGSGTEFDFGKTILPFAMSINAANILEFGRSKGAVAVFLAFAMGLADIESPAPDISHGPGRTIKNRGASAQGVAAITSGPVADAERLLAKTGLSRHVRFVQTVPEELMRKQETDLVIIDAGLDGARSSAILADMAGCLKPGGYILIHDASSRNRRTKAQKEARIFSASEKILTGDTYARVCLDVGSLPMAIYQTSRII